MRSTQPNEGQIGPVPLFLGRPVTENEIVHSAGNKNLDRNDDHRRKLMFALLFAVFIFSFNHLKANNEIMKSKITKNLRCLICQGQSVYDSDSEFANSLKIVVDNKINEGLSEKQIYSYFQGKYGEWILYDPMFNKNTYFLWLLPLLIFFIGGAIIFNKFIKKQK